MTDAPDTPDIVEKLAETLRMLNRLPASNGSPADEALAPVVELLRGIVEETSDEITRQRAELAEAHKQLTARPSPFSARVLP